MKTLGTVMIVDDEAYVRESLADLLRRRRFNVRTAATAAEVLDDGNRSGLDAVVTDLKLKGEDGHDLVRRLAELEPGLPIIVLTAYGSVGSAVECMRSGAFEYLLKPTNPDELTLVLERALGQAKLQRELEYLRASTAPAARQRPLGNAPGWQRVLELAETAAPVDTSVLLLGESGTGKEVVAKYLHDTSPRRDAAFVRVNCAAIPSELFESELFGHRRGAFTGAVADRDGRFRIAHGGTLFLDEINSLSEVGQAKVLRVLQDGTFERVGDSRPTTVDVRLVCASNADLSEEVKAGRFRADLFYRINVMTIRIPPLRERPEDVPVFAHAFLAELAERLARPAREIEPEVLAALAAYPWPGNVRELRNVIERGVLLEKSPRLRLESLPAELQGGEDKPQAAYQPALVELNLRAAVAATERAVLENALDRSRGVRREAARLLGVDERNLAYFLRKHDLMDWGRQR